MPVGAPALGNRGEAWPEHGVAEEQRMNRAGEVVLLLLWDGILQALPVALRL